MRSNYFLLLVVILVFWCVDNSKVSFTGTCFLKVIKKSKKLKKLIVKNGSFLASNTLTSTVKVENTNETLNYLKVSSNKVKNLKTLNKASTLLHDSNFIKIPLTYKSLKLYTTQISVGNPPVVYEVLIDSGSANLILLSKRNNKNIDNKGKTLYNYKESSASKLLSDLSKYFINIEPENGEISDDDGNVYLPHHDLETNSDMIGLTYGAGNIETLAVEDIVCLQNKCTNMMVLEVVNQFDTFDDVDFDGILGLDFSLNGIDNENNYLSSLYNSKQIQNREFSFYFSKNKSKNSELAIGGANSNKFDKKTLNFFNVLGEDYWEIKIKEIFYGDTKLNICKNVCSAIVDSGTAPLSFKRRDLDMIYPLLDCNQSQNFTILLENLSGEEVKIIIEEEYFKDSSKCKFNLNDLDILEFNDRDTILLGSDFLRKYYSIFNFEYNTVGLAIANHN